MCIVLNFCELRRYIFQLDTQILIRYVDMYKWKDMLPCTSESENIVLYVKKVIIFISTAGIRR